MPTDRRRPSRVPIARPHACPRISQTLTVGLRGLPPLVDGTLHARVRPEDCLWQLQDSHRLIVSLPKLAIDKHEWWPSW